MAKVDLKRCPWCGDDPLYQQYHDLEWGLPVHDDTRLFEMLILEGAQAGLSWITILRKRQHYRAVFDGFDAGKISEYDEGKVALLMADPGIVRNRLKIGATIRNARAFLEIQGEFKTFDRFLWNYVDGQPLQNRWSEMREVPARTELSDLISKDLKKRGMSFVGSTIIYAYLQAVGVVNDHLIGCYRHPSRSMRSRIKVK
ncbi:MAG: DNA-3-methyladenine glycosylase I [Acidobacteriota bacterium]